MAHRREEETELKLPSNPSTCTPTKSPDPSPDLPTRPRPRSGISQRIPSDDIPPPANNNKNNIIIINNNKKITLNRCAGCRKKVGLTGFRCRCGELFCTEHRYSDRHDCSYDYKAAGREAIARDNPVVRPAKLLKV